MDIVFQSSDLAGARRVEFLQAARAGGARLRDKDGTSLVMLPESHVDWLESMAQWATAHLRLQELLRRGVPPTVSDLGELAWLRVFGLDDLSEFTGELNDALVTAHADRSADSLKDCVNAWRVTARQLADPLRQEVLLGTHDAQDFVETQRPSAELDSDDDQAGPPQNHR
jgi:hypothetical protein